MNKGTELVSLHMYFTRQYLFLSDNRLFLCWLILLNEFDRHDITDILLKVTLNTITITFKDTYLYECLHECVCVLPFYVES
jgi:hypothetical protein